MSDDQTTACLWDFGSEFILSPQQLGLPTREQRSIMNIMMGRELGCHHRLRAVVQLGLQAFADVNNKWNMVDALIDYIVEVENTAATYEQEEKRQQLHSRMRAVPPCPQHWSVSTRPAGQKRLKRHGGDSARGDSTSRLILKSFKTD